MAIIYSYPYAQPKLSDLIVGTVTHESGAAVEIEGNPTRSFTLSDVIDLVPTYSLISQAAGTNVNIVLQKSDGTFSAVNLIRGNGISLTDNGSDGITISNLGVISVAASNTNFINMTPSAASIGNVSISASLSATGTPSALTYLRGDNTWATPVLTVNTASTDFINITPSTATNGNVVIVASLSATGTPSSSSYLRGDNTWATIDVGVVDSIVAGTGISVNATDPANPIVTNTLPDQTVVLTGSGSTTITGTYPSFNIDSTDTTYTAGTGINIASEVITNTAPDQVVSLTAGSNITVTGTYPSFTIAATGGGGGGVTSVVAGTGITVDATNPAAPIVTNAAPDQTVSLTAGSNVTITGTYPNFTIAATGGGGGGGITSVVGGTAISIDNTDPANPIINNTAPDQTVTITGGGATSVTGTYPSFTVSSTDTTYTAGTGISINGSNVIANTAPDQTVTITGSGSATVTGTYPSFNVSVPSISGVYVPYTGATTNVDLGTHTLSSYNLVVNHTSGGGVAATITKGGNGEALVVNKTSGSGNALSLTGDSLFTGNILATGSITGGTIVKTGGTSAQFLKADGSVDSTTYVSSVVASTGISVNSTNPAAPVITNTAPDQVVSITGSGETSVTGTYPNFTVSSPTFDAQYTVSYISTNTTAVKDYLYVITASLILTLPASPATGDKVGMSNMSGTLTVVIGRNGENIAGIAENLTIDVENIGIQFVYTGATKGWILI
jgi:hypothetical protein